MNEFSSHTLTLLIEQSAKMGAIYTQVLQGRLKPYLKKSEAFRLYGRMYVEHWVRDGLITPRKDGDHSACWRIERIELEAAARAYQLLRFI
ncbi:hypothetical protein HDC92_004331 [Pedobacter sp. AK017]|uniref:hypothetical protein n=1 Tax=Pedobacter sp. AK017 TaxID=2723073 RepID=UPI0017EEAD8A|nr:hypothetical protein [Pedobacter sp. AK017]MBB5440628.1 hypothetical protein [Pedobacter sp. AK017]